MAPWDWSRIRLCNACSGGWPGDFHDCRYWHETNAPARHRLFGHGVFDVPLPGVFHSFGCCEHLFVVLRSAGKKLNGKRWAIAATGGGDRRSP